MNSLSNAVVIASKEVYRNKRIILEEKAHEPIPWDWLTRTRVPHREVGANRRK